MGRIGIYNSEVLPEIKSFPIILLLYGILKIKIAVYNLNTFVDFL
jgi:hypothetical protein